MNTAYDTGVIRTLAAVMNGTGKRAVPKPTILELMITTRCDCRCRMCNIWRRSPEHDLSFTEIETTLADPLLNELRTVTLTGGEPFEREDIVDICRSLADNAKGLLQIYLSTNGRNVERICTGVSAILRRIPNLPRLRLGISIDHMGERHDRIRGCKGLHNNTLELIQRLRKLDDGRLKIQANVTIAPYNVNDLREMHSYFEVMNLRAFWFPAMISSNFYENENCKELLSFSPKQQTKLRDFVQFLLTGTNSLPDQYYYTGLLQTLKKGRRCFPCTAGRRFLHITATGDVFPCYVIPKDYSFGNLRDRTLSEIWESTEAVQARARQADCSTCTSCIQWYDGFATSDDMGFFLKFLATHPLQTVRQILSRGGS